MDEAVTSLTRLCLKRSFTLVFGGHPSISPLVALVALQTYGKSPVLAPPPIVIYQSEVFRGKLPDETWALFRSGIATIVWTAPVEQDDERFSQSLKAMRTRMLVEQAPDAMVCVGGMRGIPDELALFHQYCPNQRVYVLAGTGGAARMLAQERADQVSIVDQAALMIPATGVEPEMPVPYPYLLAKMLDGMVIPPPIEKALKPTRSAQPTEEAAMSMVKELSGDQGLKRLDHIQGVINRLAGNSFKLKGWCITLSSALLGLALKGDTSTAEIAFLAILPTLVFWGLDGYYLASEREFRKLYNQATSGDPLIDTRIKPAKIGLTQVLHAACGAVTAALYLTMLFIEVLVGFGGLGAIAHAIR